MNTVKNEQFKPVYKKDKTQITGTFGGHAVTFYFGKTQTGFGFRHYFICPTCGQYRAALTFNGKIFICFRCAGVNPYRGLQTTTRGGDEFIAYKMARYAQKRQGVDIIPQVRMGVAATQMERRGIRTELGDKNRAIAVTNQQLGQLRARIKKIKDWAYAQPIQDVPTIVEMMSAINRGQEMKSHWKRIADLKTAAKVLIFLQENHISNVEQLADKVTDIHEERYKLANTIKAQERRISTLNAHLAQVDIYNQHKAIYAKYKNLTPKKDVAALNSLNPFTRNKAAKDYEAAAKKQTAYYEKHADEIEQYNAASKYLKDHLNGRTVIPEKDWREEQKRLLAERYNQVEAYYKMREDVRSVEVLRRGAESLMREVTPERKPTRVQDIEL